MRLITAVCLFVTLVVASACGSTIRTRTPRHGHDHDHDRDAITHVINP